MITSVSVQVEGGKGKFVPFMLLLMPQEGQLLCYFFPSFLMWMSVTLPLILWQMVTFLLVKEKYRSFRNWKQGESFLSFSEFSFSLSLFSHTYHTGRKRKI